MWHFTKSRLSFTYHVSCRFFFVHFMHTYNLLLCVSSFFSLLPLFHLFNISFIINRDLFFSRVGVLLLLFLFCHGFFFSGLGIWAGGRFRVLLCGLIWADMVGIVFFSFSAYYYRLFFCLDVRVYVHVLMYDGNRSWIGVLYGVILMMWEGYTVE